MKKKTSYVLFKLEVYQSIGCVMLGLQSKMAQEIYVVLYSLVDIKTWFTQVYLWKLYV